MRPADRRPPPAAAAVGAAPRRPWYGLLGALPHPLALLLALAWAALIWRLSSGPISLGARLPFGRLLNNLAHGPLYAVLVGLLAFALPRRSAPFPWPRLNAARALALLAFGLAYGLLDEWHQLASPGRSGSWSDLATDLCGGLLALAAISGLERPREARSAQRVAAALTLVGLAALFATYGPPLPIA
jgi:hypothetical protein